MSILAFDVAKKELVVFDGAGSLTIPNTRTSILKLLRSHPGCQVVAEPTSSYHLELAHTAFEEGCTVCLVNPREVRSYKDSRSFRAKTDVLDARYLYEFALRHSGEIRAWTPLPGHVRALRDLLGKRQILIKSLAQLRQACSDIPGFEATEAELLAMVHGIENALAELAGEDENLARMKTIPGVGPLSAVALTYLFAAHQFATADALVAFVGLDLRVDDSGSHRGQRKLSKRGDPILRYLLGCAGWSLLRTKLGKDKRAQLVAQNRRHPERMMIGARKILKTAYALNLAKTDFDPTKWRWAT